MLLLIFHEYFYNNQGMIKKPIGTQILISGSNSFASRLQSTKAEQRSSPIVNSIPAVSDSSSSSGKESTCHGCHKSGHFIGQCPECYRCQTCHKHHHKSKGCPLSQANQSSTAAAAAEVDALGDNHATRDQQFFYDTPTTKNRINSGGTKGPNPSPSAAERSIGSGSQAPSRNTTNESAIYPYNNQQVTQQHARQEQGHITHTVTHTVIEVSILSPFMDLKPKT